MFRSKRGIASLERLSAKVLKVFFSLSDHLDALKNSQPVLLKPQHVYPHREVFSQVIAHIEYRSSRSQCIINDWKFQTWREQKGSTRQSANCSRRFKYSKAQGLNKPLIQSIETRILEVNILDGVFAVPYSLASANESKVWYVCKKARNQRTPQQIKHRLQRHELVHRCICTRGLQR